MKIRKILCITFSVCMLLGTTTFAAEKSQNVMESETFDVETQELSKSVKFNMVNPVEISRNEVDVLFDIANEKL